MKKRFGDHVDYGGYICIDYDITIEDEIRAFYERSDAKERYATYDMFNQMLCVIEAEEGELLFSLLFFMDCEDENISCCFVYGNKSANVKLDEQEEKAIKRLFESELKKTVYKDLDGCHKAYDETHSVSSVSA